MSASDRVRRKSGDATEIARPGRESRAKRPALAPRSGCSRAFLHLLSRVVNFFRLRGLPGHRDNARASQRVLRRVRGFAEPFMSPHCLCYLRQVGPLIFEEVVLSALEDAGFLVLRNRSYSGDGGVDGAFWSPALGWYAVQVKRYRSHIDRRHLLDLEDAIRRMGFDGGVFVHTGRSGRGVYDLLRKDGIILLSGDRLIDLVVHRELVHWGM